MANPAARGTHRRIGICTLFGLIVLMVAGVFLVQKMWSVHSDLRDARNNAAHLETLYNEALDEAGDWRYKYDEDIKKITEAMQEKDKAIETLKLEKQSLHKIKDELEKQLSEMKGELLLVKSKSQLQISESRNKDEQHRPLSHERE